MIHARRALVAIALLIGLGGGQVQAEDAALPDGVNIVNGIPTNLQPTTGALLFVGPDTENQFLDCSGVLIGCRTVLTAAHCICKTTDTVTSCIQKDVPALDNADLRVFFQHSGFHHVREIYINPTYVRGRSGDLALLRLSERVDGIEPARYHNGFPTTIAHGTEGIIVGFGNTGDSRVDAAIKRVGEIETADCPDGTGILEPANICWDFTAPILKPGDEANLCLMDDGGPLFIDFGNGPEVAGIHSGAGATCDEDSFSFDTNVVRSREWITEVGGTDVQRDQCSELGEVGEAWTIVQGGSGTLPKDADQRNFVFEIPRDSEVVRVTINGDTTRDGDYDMYVGLDNLIPTRFDFDCKSKGVGQFGACEFDEPGAARVNVLVRHVKPNQERGSSRFQVTVTAYRPVPPRDDPPRGPDTLRYQRRGTGVRRLTWIDDSSNEKGFEMQRRPGTDPGEPFKKRATIGANKESWTDAIPNDQVFTYRIRAYNDFGVSEWSNICVVNQKRLGRPSQLKAVDITEEQVTIKWRDNSTGESNFEIQRREAGDDKFRKLKTLPAETRSYVDRSVEAGVDYEYRIRAKGFPENCIDGSRFSDTLEVSIPD